MINKIIIGTANFTQAYGILSRESCLSIEESSSILNKAFDKGVAALDTALGYGDLTKTIAYDVIKKFKIITKINVLDSKDVLIKKMDVYKGFSIYALLIHDPSNIAHADERELSDKLAFLKQVYGIEKIGVSAYDMKDIENFSRIRTPKIVQIPLNPLNQSFNSPSFIEWAQSNKVEVHARSVFLQGILLANALPKELEAMRKEWSLVKKSLEPYKSPLHGLLLWAASKSWVHNWVMGVSSLRDLDEIFEASASEEDMTKVPLFQPSTHPLADPRNW
ncbi:MAG: aldo/keto reductase [Alphaproteobacteria bacterium]|nr:aldo/keto reductase [Alphaproteobacteria bacterium]